MASIHPGNPLPSIADRASFRLLCRRCPPDAPLDISTHSLELRGVIVTALIGAGGPMSGVVSGFEVTFHPPDAEAAMRLLEQMVFDWCDRQKEPIPACAWQASSSGSFDALRALPMPGSGASRMKRAEH